MALSGCSGSLDYLSILARRSREILYRPAGGENSSSALINPNLTRRPSTLAPREDGLGGAEHRQDFIAGDAELDRPGDSGAQELFKANSYLVAHRIDSSSYWIFTAVVNGRISCPSGLNNGRSSASDHHSSSRCPPHRNHRFGRDPQKWLVESVAD